MRLNLLIVSMTLFLPGCGLQQEPTELVPFNCSNVVGAQFQNVIRDKVHRNKPLPVLTHDKDNLTVSIVHFGSNFPLDSDGRDWYVWVRFTEEQLTLFLIVSNIYTEDDIRSALTNELARPVIVKKFASVF